MSTLVERDAVLHTLSERLQQAATTGHVALVAGEAGIGKTSVLRALARAHSARGPVWWGACDALETPHPLAPLLDVARENRTRFAAALGGARPALFEAVLDELRLAATPVLMVVEDAHWADAATLDLLKYLGRRIERARVLLAISYRDDEVGLAHPLRRVLGELPSAHRTLVEVPRLTRAGVELLAQRAGRRAEGVLEATRGNAFFVTEVLGDTSVPRAAVPRTVQDLVLARFARLPTPVQALLQWVAVVPGRAERWLIDLVLAPSVADLEAALASGLLVAESAALSYRHELGRVAVETSLSAPLAQDLQRRVLAALSAAGRATAPARLVHHALAAQDRGAISRHAPVAAREATARGAHREAAAQWCIALREGAAPVPEERSAWLEAYALECQLTDQLAEALAAREQLDRIHAEIGFVPRRALNLSRRALLHALLLDNAQADADSLQAIALLDRHAACVEQAYVWWVQAQLRMLNRDCAQSVQWAERAVALARQFGARETELAAVGTLGAATLFIDYPAGCAYLERALAAAAAEDLHWVAANSYANLGSGSGELFHLVPAQRWLEQGVAFCAAHEVDFYLNYCRAWLALCELYQGQWTVAGVHAAEAVECSGATTTSRVMALVALGRLRARRGDPGADEALDAALELAQASGTLQRLGAVRVARAEHAWLRGDAARSAAETHDALALAQVKQHPWFLGELAYWAWRAGAMSTAPPGCAEPYALEMAGNWRAAAAAWQQLGCPYERARALGHGDAEAQREALSAFDALGARPAAEAMRRHLRETGVRGVARGARATTRGNPAGLTIAEMQVLRLMCHDLRNANIAARLHRSVRTVDHHVASVLAKLGVDSRLEAVRRAEREGWIHPPPAT